MHDIAVAEAKSQSMSLKANDILAQPCRKQTSDYKVVGPGTLLTKLRIRTFKQP